MIRPLLLSLFGGSAAFGLVMPDRGLTGFECVLQIRANVGGLGVFSCPEVLCADASDCRLDTVEYAENHYLLTCACGSYTPAGPCYGVGQRWFSPPEGWFIDWDCIQAGCPLECTFLGPPWPVQPANVCDC